MKGSALWQAWQKTVRRGGKKTAFIQAEDGHEASFVELNEAALQFASLLRGKKGWVAFCLRNDLEWLTCFLGVQAAGLAALPLDPGLSEEAAFALAENLGASWFLRKSGPKKLEPKKPGRSGDCIKLSSGTSGGQPVTICCQAKHLLADGRQIIATMKIGPRDRNLGLIPFGHSYGLGNLVMPLILQGSVLVGAKSFVPSQIAPWMAKYRVTVFPAVPGILRLLAETVGGNTLKPLRLIVSAGAVLPPEIAGRIYERYRLKVHNFYGSSETGGITYDRTGAAARTGRSVGQPMRGVRVDLVRGRVRVASRAVAKRNGVFLMPDYGAWTPEKELRLLGRVKPMANIGGKKVDPQEVEQALRAIFGVSDAWVEVFRHADRDYLVAAAETQQTADEITALLEEKLAEWKLPRRLITESHLPRTVRGKLDVAQLRIRLGTG